VNVLPRLFLFELVVPKLHIGRGSTIEYSSHHPKAESSNPAIDTKRNKMAKHIYARNFVNVLPRFFCPSWLCPSRIFVEAIPKNTRVIILRPRAQFLPSALRERKWGKKFFVGNFVNAPARFYMFNLVVPQLHICRTLKS
jgi:hypothetical protein